jgi:acetyl-CoA carboxylase carboxyl transferase subunit beta
MLDRVTPRGKMRDELITIVRMLTGQSPVITGDLPGPAAPVAPEPEASAPAATPTGKA